MNVIFHHPLPINPEATSASGIRPLRMIDAFKQLGCNVVIVSGFNRERKEAIKRIEYEVSRGVRYDFVYGESSTMPNTLTDPSHLPVAPTLDFRFFIFCKRNSIPVGVFYRDIYWLFEGYGRSWSPIKTAIAKAAYRFDLWVYNRTLSKLYLPSIKMGDYLPLVNPEIFSALPPGHTSPNDIGKSERNEFSTLKLFYVGGMSPHYQLHKLFSVVKDLPDVWLTVCTRENEWLSVRHEYPNLTPNIQVIHERADAMEAKLRESDIAVLYVEPHEYWEFASPVKLYEYLGYLKPILASEGTLAGEFVKENGVGWAIKYDEHALRELLNELKSNARILERVSENLRRIAGAHSWQARAKQVIEELTK